MVEKWVENPYGQSFCGHTYFEHEVPCYPTSLLRWRHRLGAAGVEKLLTEALEAVHENPYDGATLAPALKQVERTTEVRPEAAFVDRGFKGAAHHPADVAVYVSGRKRLRRTLKALLLWRSAIEPVIGKGEHKMERNHLLGREGDRINVLLTGCGFNLRKLWRFFKAAVSLQPA